MYSLLRKIIIIVGVYNLLLYILNIFPVKKSSKLIKSTYCGGKYYIHEDHDIVCSSNFNDNIILIHDKLSVVCGEYVMTKNGAYKLNDKNNTIIIEKASSGTNIVEIINGHKSKYTINQDLNIIDNSFRMSIKKNKIFYYACSDHCVNEHFCKTNVYYIE